MQQDFWKGKRVLITGHTGFKGSWLAMLLARKGALVHGYSHSRSITSPCLYGLAQVDKKMQSEEISDIRLELQVAEYVKNVKPDVVFHLAAQPIVKEGFKDPIATFDINILGTANLLQALQKVGSAKSIVVITTDKVYDMKGGYWGYREIDPLGAYDPYSTSKACSELIAKCYSTYEMGDMPIATARAGNVIGGGDFSYRFVPMLVQWLHERKPIHVWDPNAVRPWQYVLDCLSGYVEIAEELYAGRIASGSSWNIGPSLEEYFSCLDMAELVCKEWSPDVKEIHIADCPDTYPTDVILRLDNTKSRRELLWKPKYGIVATVGSTVRWYQEFYAGDKVPDICEWYLRDYGI